MKPGSWIIVGALALLLVIGAVYLGNGGFPPPVTEPEVAATHSNSAATHSDGVDSDAGNPDDANPSAAPAAGSESAASPASADAPRARPSFDVVRVAPDGSTVLAGRAAPGSKVEIMANGEVVAETRTDTRGQFAVALDKPLQGESQMLELTSVAPDGTTRKSTEPVMVLTPKRAGAAPVVVQRAENAITMLQPASPLKDGAVSLDAIGYGDSAEVILSGRGASGAQVQVYLDNKLVGGTKVDESGQWRMTPKSDVPPGKYTLRVDQSDARGKILSRVESPFERAQPDVIALVNGQVIVQPGNSLWRIARRAYGRGVEYTIIYRANIAQIRDPDLIYPGQVFMVPDETTR